MNEIASKIQGSVAMQMPHTVREHMNVELHELAARCDEEKNVPYIWKFLSVVYKVIEYCTPTDEEWELVKNGIQSKRREKCFTDLKELSGKGKDTDKMPVINECISLWVENMEQIILESFYFNEHEVTPKKNQKDNITPEERRKICERSFMKVDQRKEDDSYDSS